VATLQTNGPLSSTSINFADGGIGGLPPPICEVLLVH
jgi:hypothetical protein